MICFISLCFTVCINLLSSRFHSFSVKGLWLRLQGIPDWRMMLVTQNNHPGARTCTNITIIKNMVMQMLYCSDFWLTYNNISGTSACININVDQASLQACGMVRLAYLFLVCVVSVKCISVVFNTNLFLSLVTHTLPALSNQINVRLQD